MLTCFIRNLIILLIATYTFYRLLNNAPTAKNVLIRILPSFMLTSMLSAKFFISNQSINWLFILLTFFLIMKYLTQNTLVTTYITTLFSFSLSFISFTISGIILSLILYPVYFRKYLIPWYLTRIFAGIIQFLLIYTCFRIPRLRKGMNTLYNIPFGNIGSTICITFIMFLNMYAQAQTYSETYILNCTALILIVCFLLIYWWNYHITQTYRKLLRKSEVDSLNLLLEEKNQEITYLRNENEKLSSIIHKDNKILPALNMAIMNSYNNQTALDFSSTDVTSSLYQKIIQHYKEREEIVANYQKEIMHLPQTSFDSVNAILSYMQTESLKYNIPFQVMLFDNLDSTIPIEIAEDDFIHILSDLLANAINACKDISSASIQVYLGKMDGISTIKILNTGNTFAIEVLKDLGLARHTTHADTGGSGIGLMDIWKIKEQYGATLLIDESVVASTTYTCVNILFNHKKHYIIQSDRDKELCSHINRPDIMIISKE